MSMMLQRFAIHAFGSDFKFTFNLDCIPSSSIILHHLPSVLSLDLEPGSLEVPKVFQCKQRLRHLS